MRKALMAEQKKNEMTAHIAGLKNACDELENEVTRQEAEVLEMVSTDEESRTKEQKDHQAEIISLKDLNLDLKRQLEELLNTTKAV
tara:strand:- start:94 stop:351 length:258 start_codon:yes stop_codon:yes gene_type:complete